MFLAWPSIELDAPRCPQRFSALSGNQAGQYLELGEYIKYDYFVDGWSDVKKLRAVQDLCRYLEQGGFAAGGAMVGFAKITTLKEGLSW